MIPYSKRRRLQTVVQPPEDIMNVNESLLQGTTSRVDAESSVLDLINSWNGVKGQFEDDQVRVSPDFIIDAETGRWRKDFDATVAIGRLGTLHVVDVEIPVIDNVGQPRGTYKGPIIAAEFSQSQGESSAEAEVNSLVALSMPHTFGTVAISFHRR